MIKSEKPKITIGLPVLNGEQFIQKKLHNLQSQTFQNYILLISDDSTDRTSEICKTFAKHDKRIKYVHQTTKKGWRWNWSFLLENSDTEYFVWTAVDDFWDETFLEKNISFLDSTPSFVASMSQKKMFDDNGVVNEPFKINFNDSFLSKNYKKFRQYFRPWNLKSIQGAYEKKVREFLELRSAQYDFSVVKTSEFKKSVLNEPFSDEWEIAIMVNLLEFGDFFVFDEFLMNNYIHGISSGGVISSWRKGNESFFDVLFPYGGQILWYYKKLGIKFFIKNLDIFIQYFIYGEISLFVELIKIILKKS